MKTLYVCRLHFQAEDLTNCPLICKLKPEMVPSIFPKEFAPEKRIHVLNSIILKPVEENVQPSTSTSHTDMVPLFGEDYPLSSIIQEKDNLFTTSTTLMEPPMKKKAINPVDTLREDKENLDIK